MLSDNPRDEKHVGCKTARRQRRSLGLARQKSARWARLEDGDAGIIDGLTTERLCSCWRAPARDEAVCLLYTQHSPRITIRLRQIQDCAPPVIGAHNDSYAKCAHREPRYATFWTTRQKAMTEAAATAAQGKMDTTDKPRWRALQQLLL